MDITKSREEFEEWLESKNKSNFRELLTRGFLRSYLHDSTQSQWEVWKAARESIVVELPELCGDGENDTDYIEGLNDGINQSARALRAAGIRIKGESE